MIRSCSSVLILFIISSHLSEGKNVEYPTYNEVSALDEDAVSSIVFEVVEYVVEELPKQPEIANAKYRMTLGALSPTFEGFNDAGRAQLLLDSIKSEFLKNDFVSDRFRIIGLSKREAEVITDSLNQDSHSDDYADPLGLAGDAVRNYDPRDLYLLSGSFLQSRDAKGKDNYRTIRASIEILHPASRRVVLECDVIRSFKWHKRKRVWREIE